MDATYEPVNALDDQDRDRVIIRDYHLLRDDLAAMLSDRSIPILLVKTNICRLLAHKLTEDGFNVLNNGRIVYFPSTGRQKDFHTPGGHDDIANAVAGALVVAGKPVQRISMSIATGADGFGRVVKIDPITYRAFDEPRTRFRFVNYDEQGRVLKSRY